MISKMNYLLLSTMMVAAMENTFGRCCDCCKKLCADKGSNEPPINNVDNNTNVEYDIIKMNENTAPINMETNTNDNENNLIENIENNNNSNTRRIIHNEKFDTKKVNESEEKKTLSFTKIDKTDQEEVIKKCFNGRWYKACEGKVLLLKEAEEGDTDVLSVTGSGNNWEITDQGNVLKNANCNPNNNKWIIVKVITLDSKNKKAGDSFIFYVDEIKVVSYSNVFDSIKCYSIEIIAANTSAVESMRGLFYHVESALEQNMGEGAGPGLIGLDKLNVENVKDIAVMFCSAIRKQATLEQLKKWRFSGKKDVDIDGLFSSAAGGLNFRVLDDWSKAEKSETVIFITRPYTRKDVFIRNNEYEFTAPNWYSNIKEVR